MPLPSQETSSNNRCCGSIRRASRRDIKKSIIRARHPLKSLGLRESSAIREPRSGYAVIAHFFSVRKSRYGFRAVNISQIDCPPMTTNRLVYAAPDPACSCRRVHDSLLAGQHTLVQPGYPIKSLALSYPKRPNQNTNPNLSPRSPGTTRHQSISNLNL